MNSCCLRLGIFSKKIDKTWLICEANSRVGLRISAPIWLGFKGPSGRWVRISKTGSRKARVLPLPVTASAATSFRSKNRGIVANCKNKLSARMKATFLLNQPWQICTKYRCLLPSQTHFWSLIVHKHRTHIGAPYCTTNSGWNVKKKQRKGEVRKLFLCFFLLIQNISQTDVVSLVDTVTASWIWPWRYRKIKIWSGIPFFIKDMIKVYS